MKQILEDSGGVWTGDSGRVAAGSRWLRAGLECMGGDTERVGGSGWSKVWVECEQVTQRQGQVGLGG